MRDRLLNHLADVVCRRPWPIVMVAALLAGMSAWYAATSLRLNANLDDLIARDRPYMLEYRRFLQEFGDLEYIIVAIDASTDRAAAERAADDLLNRLRAIPDLPGEHGAIESEEQLRLATRAMSDDELREFATASNAFPSLMNGDAASVLNHADALLERLVTTGAAMSPDEQQRTTAASMFLLESLASIQNPESRIQNPKRRYLESDSGRILFINILPAKDYSTLAVIEQPLQRIRAAIDETRSAFPGIDIGLTGKPVMQYDELSTSNSDMTRASIIAFVLCAILFMLMIGGAVRPLLAMLAFACATAWTYGFATLAVGQLNLLSLVFVLVLVGVGLDYGVHVINRSQEFLARGASVHESTRGAMQTAVRGNITGALTSSIVFFMALLTSFQGLRELGLIAGAGLLMCLIAMSVVLPALLVIVDGRRSVVARAADSRRTLDAPHVQESWLQRHARRVLVAAVLATIVLGAVAFIGPGAGGRFDYNLLNLQADGLESIEWERRILTDSAAESWFAAVIADDQAQAQAIIDGARSKPTIGAIRSAFDIVQPDSPQRDSWRGALHQSQSPRLAGGNAHNDLTATLQKATTRLQLIAQAAASQAPDESQRMLALAARLNAMNPNDAATRRSMDESLASIATNLRLMLEGDRLPVRDALPAAVRDQFVSPAGKYLVMLHPNANVWEYAPMQAFIADVRSVAANATGVPITHFESLGEMRRAFVMMSLLAIVAIIVLLTIDFRSVRDVLLALTPLLVGMIWTVGAMRVLGVSFNLANFFAVPMLIGLGVDSAVHILHRFHERGDIHLGRTRRAVILTSLTTIIGFGALLIAHHRGLRSLGLVMALGAAACMLSSLVVLPALLSWRVRAPRTGA